MAGCKTMSAIADSTPARRNRVHRFFMGVAIGITMFASLLAAAAPPTGNTFEAGRLERVKALGGPVIEGAVRTYYTPGYEKRARKLQRFVDGERTFVKKELGIDVPLSLAVLDPAQWKLVERQLPYSMPSVTGDPPVALVPADWPSAPQDIFAKESDAGPAVVEAVAAHGLSWNEANYQAYDLANGHELGHAVIDTYGIVPGTHWLNEMLASYVLYAFLQQERRDLLWLDQLMQAANPINRPQRHVSLDDFEAQYMQILTTDGRNYGWYQGQFFGLVRKVYARKGIGFLLEVRAAFPEGEKWFALGNAETLRRLEDISPGFVAWARDMNALPRLPDAP